MPSPLNIALENLRDSSRELNSLTDQAAELVKRVEDFLNKKCSIGMSTYVEVDADALGAWVLYLAYERVDGRFRIAVDFEYTDDSDEFQTTAWSDCSRHLKLKTMEHLPKLLTEIAENANEEVAQTREKVTSLTDAFDSFLGEDAQRIETAKTSG